MKKIIALLLALSCLLSLAACGEDAEPSKKKTTKETTQATTTTPTKPTTPGTPSGDDGFTVYSYSSSTAKVPVGDIDPNSIYDSMTYIPEMFYGEYRIHGLLEDDDDSAYKEYAESVSSVSWWDSYYFDCEITSIPMYFAAGPQTLGKDAIEIEGLDLCLVYYMINRTYSVWYWCAYSVEGSTLTLNFFSAIEQDEETGEVLSYTLAQNKMSYTFRFKGTSLTLSAEDDSLTLYTALDKYDDDLEFDITANATPGKDSLLCVDYLAIEHSYSSYSEEYYNYLYAKSEHWGYLNDAACYVGYDGQFKLNLIWENYNQQFLLVYFYCGEDGLILTDGEKTYFYTRDPYDNYREELEENLSDEDKEKVDDLTDDQVAAIVEKKQQLLTSLKTAFNNANVEIDINHTTGEITLSETILFGVNEYNISAEGKTFLETFIDIYTGVVFSGEYDDFISTILVEGHTDTNGSYDMNKTLSQNRADSVRNYCLSCSEYAQLAELMQAVGYAYDKPIYDENGVVDMAASRRVSFRLLINIGD